LGQNTRKLKKYRLKKRIFSKECKVVLKWINTKIRKSEMNQKYSPYTTEYTIANGNCFSIHSKWIMTDSAKGKSIQAQRGNKSGMSKAKLE
jgi:hypothetical protein